MSTETPRTDAFEPTHQISVHHWADFARSLEAELEDLRQFKKEVDGEGVVPATRVLDKERQVSELTAERDALLLALDRAKLGNECVARERDKLTARIAELEANQDRLKNGLRWIRDNAEPDGAKRARIVLESEEAK